MLRRPSYSSLYLYPQLKWYANLLCIKASLNLLGSGTIEDTMLLTWSAPNWSTRQISFTNISIFTLGNLHDIAKWVDGESSPPRVTAASAGKHWSLSTKWALHSEWLIYLSLFIMYLPWYHVIFNEDIDFRTQVYTILLRRYPSAIELVVCIYDTHSVPF